MKTKNKSKAGNGQLIIGIIAIAIALGVIIYGYGFLSGSEADNQVVLDMSHESYTVSLIGLMLFPLFIGVYGGIEIGGYIQTHLRKEEKA